MIVDRITGSSVAIRHVAKSQPDNRLASVIASRPRNGSGRFAAFLTGVFFAAGFAGAAAFLPVAFATGAFLAAAFAGAATFLAGAFFVDAFLTGAFFAAGS